MSFSILEKEIWSLSVELQNSSEMYTLLVINQYKKSSQKGEEKRSVEEIVDSLTGIISSSELLKIKDIKEERLNKEYGL